MKGGRFQVMKISFNENPYKQLRNFTLGAKDVKNLQKGEIN